MKTLLPLLILLMMGNEKQTAQAVDGNNKNNPGLQVMMDLDGRVFYEIFIRSFYDSNDDGIGDLNGITVRLDYLKQLGIGGIWITPFHPSPSYHKYDVTDYHAVDPQYGTLDDFKNLVVEAHKRNILVLMDLVINHTSSRHPWFRAAVAGDSTYRNFYSWQLHAPDTHDGGWYTAAGDKSGEKYFAFFSPVMPDLNFDNEAVRKEIISIGEWWLTETGIDGYRLDAAQHIYDADHPEKNVAWWKQFTDAMKEVKPDVITIGECWNNYPLVAQYLPALSGVFNFELSWALLKALQDEKQDQLVELIETIRHAYESYSDTFIDPIFLSNHDCNRILSDLNNHDEKAKLAACIYLTLPGTPFIYYGEELGMRGEKPDSIIREPFLWAEAGKDEHQTTWEHAVSSTDQTVHPLNEQLTDTHSFYTLYKTLIAFRHSHAVLTSRHIETAELDNPALLAYLRGEAKDQLLVIHNLSQSDVTLSLPDVYRTFKDALFSQPAGVSLQDGEIHLPSYGSVVLGSNI